MGWVKSVENLSNSYLTKCAVPSGFFIACSKIGKDLYLEVSVPLIESYMSCCRIFHWHRYFGVAKGVVLQSLHQKGYWIFYVSQNKVVLATAWATMFVIRVSNLDSFMNDCYLIWSSRDVNMRQQTRQILF